MALHHVAQCTGAIVKRPASIDAHRFGDGNLHLLDCVRVPQRFENRVGKAQREQILHRFFAEVMIDAEYLVFFKRGTDRFVHLARGLGIGADRFFDDDATGGIDQTRISQCQTNRPEQLRAGGKIENDAAAVFAVGST